MAKVDSDSNAMSASSAAYLEEVKKGKTRKYAMICKGTQVISLVIYKKGNVAKRKKEAKEAGKGQFYFGVVDGKGIDIRFVLARADGFESEPVKNSVLKAFLEESADFKCKPHFEIVDVAPVALDEDDPLVISFRTLQNQALLAGQSLPDRAADIGALCDQIETQLDQDQPEEVASKMSKLESLLSGLAGSAPTAPPPPPLTNGLGQEAKLKQALHKLKPLLEQAISLHANRKKELIDAVTKARDEIAQGQLDQAQGVIVALGKLLQSLLAKTPVSSARVADSDTEAVVPDKASVLSRLKAISDAIKAALAGPDAVRVKVWVDAIKDQIGRKNFAEADNSLNELLTLLVTAHQPPRDTENAESLSIVKLGKARLEWDGIRLHAVRELQRLKQILQEQYASDGDARAALSAAFTLLDSTIMAMNEELGDRLDELLNTEPARRPLLATSVKAVLGRFVNLVESDKLMAVIDGNEYAPDMQVAAPLRGKLQEIASILA